MTSNDTEQEDSATEHMSENTIHDWENEGVATTDGHDIIDTQIRRCTVCGLEQVWDVYHDEWVDA